MFRARIAASLVLLSAAAPALADIPLPPDRKYVDPRVRFEGLDKHSDYVFFLRFRSGVGNPFAEPPVTLPIKDDKPFNMHAKRRLVDMHVLAMAKKVYDKKKAEDASEKWLSEETAGVLRANVKDTPSTVGSAKDKEGPLVAYRLSIADGKLAVETIKERGDAAPGNGAALAMIGLGASLSLAGLGLWSVRRSSAA